MNFRCFPIARTTLFALILSASACSEVQQDKMVTPESNDPKIRKLKLPQGFVAERLYSPGENDQGSWVSMTFDDKGRMIASDQFGAIYRIQLPAIGDSSVQKAEKLVIGKADPADTSSKVRMGYAQGLLYAFNSLYIMVNRHNNDKSVMGSGLYRLRDTDGDDQFDEVKLLKAMEGEGEHGPHSIILSPDKKSLYLVAGNHTDVPPMGTYRLPNNWKEDNLFPLITDPSGHANDRMAPGGWIAHVDSLGERWELVSAGFRNTFDIAFNDAGDLFAYDSDMEYDIGMPWYRPTRICHVTSGGEFGWRTGNSKWSPAFPDNLPAMINIGQGSPTNLTYAGNAKFPEKYRNSLLAFDWSFGIIYSISMKPEGATYKAQAEEFISGAPLPLTDGVIGPDGALYFLTGGRRLDSDLYRVYYKEQDGEKGSGAATAGADEKNEDSGPEGISEENKLRRELETYHERKPGAVEFAWPKLAHKDRFVRYAARIAIEHQPVDEWQDRVFAEKDPVILTQSAIALARQGNASVRDRLLQVLNGIDYKGLQESQQLDLLRAYELVFARMGNPAGTSRQEVIAALEKHFPAESNHLNRQLSKLMIHLEAPGAVPKTIALMENAKDGPSDQQTFTESSDLIFRNPQYGIDIANMLSKVPPAQQTYYATMLGAAKTGWTPELRERYFKWFYDAFGYKGGQSFVGFIDRARKMALSNVPKADFAHFNTISGDSLVGKSGRRLAGTDIRPSGPYRQWTLEDAVALIDTPLAGRNFVRGKGMFDAVMCGSCHGMRGEGADIGPDLTQLGTRFSEKDILESIIDPDKTISDQYGATVFYLNNGKSVVGRLVRQDEEKYYISQNPFARDVLREIPKSEVTSTQMSQVSIMMEGLINGMNGEEVKDLLAYLVAGGNKEHPVFKGGK